MYGRVDLTKVHYELDPKIVLHKPDYYEALHVYKQYCQYKKFDSVIPFYRDDIRINDFHCLYQDGKLIAWQQTQLYTEDKVAWNEQFAWDYSNPRDKIGWRFKYHITAYYKANGYKYLYLGDHHDYKSKIQGYEILGPYSTHRKGGL